MSETINGERRSVGRPLTRERDATMRYIAKKNLWSAIALQCQISESAVRAWTRVPKARVDDVCRATGRSLHLIRPDLWSDVKLNPNE
jgi:hypothetical protein